MTAADVTGVFPATFIRRPFDPAGVELMEPHRNVTPDRVRGSGASYPPSARSAPLLVLRADPLSLSIVARIAPRVVLRRGAPKSAVTTRALI